MRDSFGSDPARRARPQDPRQIPTESVISDEHLHGVEMRLSQAVLRSGDARPGRFRLARNIVKVSWRRHPTRASLRQNNLGGSWNARAPGTPEGRPFFRQSGFVISTMTDSATVDDGHSSGQAYDFARKSRAALLGNAAAMAFPAASRGPRCTQESPEVSNQCNRFGRYAQVWISRFVGTEYDVHGREGESRSVSRKMRPCT